VFEIGNSLHEARSRRGIDFPEAELATKIRGKYLRALEDERFELLPAQTYIKGFLRTYAEYLGLDGQLYVDEYNSRFGAGDDSDSRARRSAVRPQRRNRRIETNVVLISLAAIAVVTIVVIAAWKSTGSSPPAAPTTPVVTKAKVTPRRVAPPLLLVKPLRGSAHVTVRRGGANGSVAFDGTLQKGNHPVSLQGGRLWLQIDSPENVRLEVRGRVVHVPGLAPRVIIITPLGWQIAPS
jgi:cytoskeleton protein RodZ